MHRHRQSNGYRIEEGTLRPYRWLRWWLIGGASLVTGTAAMHVCWALASQRALEDAGRQLAEWDEFPRPDEAAAQLAPPVHSAASALEEAITALSLSSEQLQAVRSVTQLAEYDAESESMLAGILQDTESARQKVRQARRRSRLEWPVRIREATRAVRRRRSEEVNREFRMLQVLCACAFYQHKQRNDQAAIESLIDALAVSRYIGQLTQRGSHAWALLGDRWVVYYLEEMATDLFLDPAIHDDGSAGAPASRRQVEELIALLLDDSATREQVERCLQMERRQLIERTQRILQGKLGVTDLADASTDTPTLRQRAELLLFKPMYRFDAVRLLQNISAVTERAPASSWVDVKNGLPARRRLNSSVSRFTHPLTRRIDFDVELYLKLRFRTLAMKRMGALLLAIRLFEHAHAHLPNRLEDLVPEYIAAVPRDPLAAGAKTLSCNYESRRQVLYSVGFNGVDEGGKLPADFSAPSHWQEFDLPVFLNGRRPWGKIREN